MLPLTKEKLKLLQDTNVNYIRGKRIKIKLSKMITYQKVRDYCHDTSKCKGTAHIICSKNLMFPMESLWFFKRVHILIITLSSKN